MILKRVWGEVNEINWVFCYCFCRFFLYMYKNYLKKLYGCWYLYVVFVYEIIWVFLCCYLVIWLSVNVWMDIVKLCYFFLIWNYSFFIESGLNGIDNFIMFLVWFRDVVSNLINKSFC